MKKIVLALAAVAVVACFSLTSCNKKCECKTYVAGVVASTTEVEVESGKKCKDYTILVSEDPKYGQECKATL